MINTKSVQRKKSQTLIATKDHRKEEQTMIKRKKSVSNLVCSSKLKKQVIVDKQQKPTKKHKQQKQKKLVHSVSKGKLNKKHHKSQKNDENFNSMNHKRSIDKFHTIGKASKQMIKTKKECDQIAYEGKNQKIKAGAGECHLTKVGSVGKFSVVKKVQKKKGQCKEMIDDKHFFRNDQQKTYDEKLKNTSSQVTKTLAKNPTSKKLITGQKSKLKKSQSTSQIRKSTRQKMKPNSKLAQIIQRSILYSEVNYDFKQQTSFLVSGIKKQEDFFTPYPFHFEGTNLTNINIDVSSRAMIQYKAAVTIQRHFRGYIQRKYIEQARFIIDCIKKIQRFWRVCLMRRRQCSNKIQVKKDKIAPKAQIQNSLITVKDLNEDRGKDNCSESRNGSNGDVDRNMLKDIIKNLLLEETVGESIKVKIRTAMMDDNQKITNIEPTQRQKTQDHQKSPKLQPRQIKPIPSSLQIQTNLPNEEQEHTKQDYVKRKISMEINSEKNFNSPMINASKEFLTSPNIKRLTSPKCLSSSFSKDAKGSYNNYFKSNRNGVFMSPKSSKEEGQRILMSHSGSKWSKQKDQYNDGHCVEEAHVEENKAYSCQKQLKIAFQSEAVLQSQLILSAGKSTLQVPKVDYQLKSDINLSSPIIQCKSPSQSFTEQVNYLTSQKLAQSEQQTHRQRNFNEEKLFSPSIIKNIRPFPTEFCFIEQFCLLITDYLREDEESTQVFLQKVKGLKYCKMQKVFQSWQRIQYEEYWCDNQPLQLMILQQHSNRPAIFSRTQKNLLLQYPSLRLFLSQNDYSTQEISFDMHPKSAYIKFMFDSFEQCIYENYRHVSLRDLALIQSRQTKKGVDYMSVILSQAMGNMLRSAQMLCGSFEADDMTEVEKEERKLMNQMRMAEMIKDYREDRLDQGSCVLWIQLLLGKLVFEDLVEESTQEIMCLISLQQ